MHVLCLTFTAPIVYECTIAIPLSAILHRDKNEVQSNVIQYNRVQTNSTNSEQQFKKMGGGKTQLDGWKGWLNCHSMAS